MTPPLTWLQVLAGLLRPRWWWPVALGLAMGAVLSVAAPDGWVGR